MLHYTFSSGVDVLQKSRAFPIISLIVCCCEKRYLPRPRRNPVRGVDSRLGL